ncbi:MAG: TfoX/Sxy family protein [Ardenticatenaceae bacterium]|nr:TfoX/Sxy family protein [Ardenticatenaceae bacterium]HBY93967.1 RNA methyltransferase [Chloroflexota bacterium]
MPYDEHLARRVRVQLEQLSGLVEKKMFGGIAFMINGNMACGVNGEDLIVRVGPDQYQEAMTQPFVRVFDMTGRPMKGWIVIGPEGYESEDRLRGWIQQGVAFAQSLPAK